MDRARPILAVVPSYAGMQTPRFLFAKDNVDAREQ